MSTFQLHIKRCRISSATRLHGCFCIYLTRKKKRRRTKVGFGEMWRLWWLYCAKCFSHLIHAIQKVLVYNCREFHALSEYVRLLEYITKERPQVVFFEWISLENIIFLLKKFSLLKIKITKFWTHHSMQFDVLFHMRLNSHSPISLMWPIGPIDWGPVFWARSIVWRICFPTWDTFNTIKR